MNPKNDLGETSCKEERAREREKEEKRVKRRRED